MPLIAITNLHLRYPVNGRVVRAVDGITFSIESRGETVGIVEETSCAKLELMNTLKRWQKRVGTRWSVMGRELRPTSWRGLDYALNIVKPISEPGARRTENLQMEPTARPIGTNSPHIVECSGFDSSANRENERMKRIVVRTPDNAQIERRVPRV